MSDRNKAAKKVVGQVSKSLLNSFERVGDQEIAAKEWLGQLVSRRKDLWKEVEQNLGLDLDKKDYELDMKTGEILEKTSFETEEETKTLHENTGEH